ncbi:unnamed protein product, partial [Mesorhabditis spiculigera]
MYEAMAGNPNDMPPAAPPPPLGTTGAGPVGPAPMAPTLSKTRLDVTQVDQVDETKKPLAGPGVNVDRSAITVPLRNWNGVRMPEPDAPIGGPAITAPMSDATKKSDNESSGWSKRDQRVFRISKWTLFVALAVIMVAIFSVVGVWASGVEF